MSDLKFFPGIFKKYDKNNEHNLVYKKYDKNAHVEWTMWNFRPPNIGMAQSIHWSFHQHFEEPHNEIYWVEPHK